MDPQTLDDYFKNLQGVILNLHHKLSHFDLQKLARAVQQYRDAVQRMTKANVYRHTLDDADVGALRHIHTWLLKHGGYEVDVRQALPSYTERSRVTQLRYHGLLAKALNKEGKHKASLWILTRRGAQFLKGELLVPKWVESCKNKLTGVKSEVMVSAHDFHVLDDFGPHYTIVGMPEHHDLVTVTPEKLPL